MGAILEDDGLFREILEQGARECILKNHMEQLAPAIRRTLRVNCGNSNGAGKRKS